MLLIYALITHFSCKLIDFIVNFHYFLVNLQLEKINDTCQ